MDLIHRILLDTAETFESKVAVRDPMRALTYGRLAEEVMKQSSRLLSLDVAQRARVVTILPNSVDFFVSHFSALNAGFVSVPCDPGISIEGLNGILKSCQPAFIVTNAFVYKRLAEAIRRAEAHAVVLMDDQRGHDENGTPIINIGDLPSHPVKDRAPQGWETDEIATIMYTSGSTGLAKGVCLTHQNVIWAITNICQFVGYTSEDTEVDILPLSHNFGLGQAYCNLAKGGTVYTEPGLVRVKRVLEALEGLPATGFSGTPSGFSLLMDRYGPVFKEKCRNLRFIIINSEAMPPKRTEQLQQLLPHVDIMVYYGLTEASRSTFISLTRMGPDFYHSVGRPMRGIKLSILDPNGVALAPFQIGEIVIEGPTVTKGYWKAPDQTAAVIREGKLYTGDLGYVDDAGFLFITGRLKDMINVGGLKVSPEEVERVLREYPGVLDAAVVGIKDCLGLPGESVVAAIVWGGEDRFASESCKRFCLTRLEPYKVPRSFVALDAIPRSENGKLLRAVIEAKVMEKLNTHSGEMMK